MTKDTLIDFLGYAAIAIAVVVVMAVVLIGPPIILSWCLNTLFRAGIEFNSYTIAAALILIGFAKYPKTGAEK